MSEEGIKEQILIRSLQGGHPFAFKTLYEKYAPRLQAFSTRFHLSKEEADEIVQETFIRIWQHRQQINEEAPFGTYMITIAKRLIYNHLKHMSHRLKYVKEVTQNLKTSSGYNITNEAELNHLIAKAIQNLPEKCRIIFKKSRLEGYSNQQIADELCLSKSTVENQINKALKTIRKNLENKGYATTLFLIILLNYPTIF